MNDLYHYIGGDLSASPSGDLRPVSGVELGRQRLLRRLMTNPGDCLFHPDYGAGLGRKIGELTNIGELTGLVRGQMLLEASVARIPPPGITVTPINDGVSVYLEYTDAPSGQRTTLSFDVTR